MLLLGWSCPRRHDKSGIPALNRLSLFASLTMVKGLAGARRSSAHENWIRDVVRRFHLNTTESRSPLTTTTHGVNHVPSSSAHRKPFISVDTVVSELILEQAGGSATVSTTA